MRKEDKMYNSVLQDPSMYRAGIYIRLSEADEGKSYESESESVKNQRELLTSYVNNSGFQLAGEYVDDGFSGTDFDRPGFKKLLDDIKNKVINLVIVKDLSRLGRDHIMTGYYMETFFPTNQIRFISILEAYDSCKNQASNDSSTFIIACNDYYSKQNSIKIRNVLNEKKKNGKFVGSLPCYGYMRDPDDKGHLIPDPKTAPIVKQIFNWLNDGIGISEIVTRLNNNNIESPSKYKGIALSKRRILDGWSISAVKKIKTNQMYCGDMVQSTQTKLSYKSKKKVSLDHSMWIIVENTHEALVDKRVFLEINKNPSRTSNVRYKRKIRLLENLLFCKECGNRLSVSYRRNHDYWSVNCNRYSRDPKRKFCGSHFFPYDILEKQILDKIKSTCESYMNELDIDEISATLKSEKLMEEKNKEDNKLVESKISDLKRKISDLYDDKLDGIIDKDTYIEKSNRFKKELSLLNSKCKRGFYQELNTSELKKEVPEYKEKIKKLLDLDNPNKELLFSLISRIEIDNERNIEINYKYGIIEKEVFKYITPDQPRNPYGKKGKNKNKENI
jgi:site-specific DNA recombinase